MSKKLAGHADKRGFIMVLLNVMLVTAFVILLAVAVDEVLDTYRLTRPQQARQPQ